MDMVSRYGLMVLVMKAIGNIIKLVEKESFGMLMGMSLKVNGKMIKPMVMESIFI